jgi:hypothetical protein
MSNSVGSVQQLRNQMALLVKNIDEAMAHLKENKVET